MKRFTAVLLALVLALGVAACQKNPGAEQSPEPSEEAFVFTRENMPRLDGSTSTAPLDHK